MKNILSVLLAIFILLGNFAFAQNSQPAPDFSPPKDLSGPVFPIEDVIGKPGPASDKFLSEFISMLATLGLIIALILIVAWFLKRMVNARQDQANETSIIKVLERRSLSPKTAIYLLDVEGKSLIIAESVNGVTHLVNYNTSEDEEGKHSEIPSPFKKILEQK
jgi:flagellar biogenesis protein FliO